MKIKEIEIDGERISLKKSGKNWRVVKPRKIDGKINWKNLLTGGSWWNLLGIALIVILIIGCISEYSIALKTANDCLLKDRLIQEGFTQIKTNLSNLVNITIK